MPPRPDLFVARAHSDRRRVRLIATALLLAAVSVLTPFDLTPRGATADGVEVTVVPITSVDDDAQERPNGHVDTRGRALDLGQSRGPQVVGLRFVGVDVPAGATIVRAHVQFGAAAVSSGGADLAVQAEAIDDAPAFTTTRRDLSSRSLTAARVTWAPDTWNEAGRTGAAERTPDLAPVLQEVVDTAGWTRGNAVALLVTGSGLREALAGGSARPPALVLEWSTPVEPTPEPTSPVPTDPTETETPTGEPTGEPSPTDEPTASPSPTDPSPTTDPSPEPTTSPTPTETASPEPTPTATTTPPGEPGEVRAFPTAEGFGQAAVGGRGGRVIEVTSLADAGPGTLRAALEASGPRIVVFRVAGTITLQERIRVEDPYVTVAGQTAPGDGVQVRNHPDSDDEAIRIETHDVVVRHLRVRPGPTSSPACCSGGITLLHGARDVVLDHTSVSWGVDENIGSGDGAHDYTIQWSVIAQALDDSTHEEGPHSMGVHIGSYTRDFPASAAHSVTLHHNLLAHNDRRNPKLTNAGRDVLVNNVIYNWRDAAIHAGDDSGQLFRGAVVGNHLIAGPDTDFGQEMYLETEFDPTPGFEIFMRGNVGPNQPDPDGDQRLLMWPEDREWVVDAPTFSWPSIRTTSAAQALDEVLASAGATVPSRDRVDAGIVDSVRRRTGGLIDDPSEVGGWPTLAGGTPYPDADHDGMDDGWEQARGLDPSDPGDGSTTAPNGYTWVENFLNALAGDPIP